MPAVLYAAVCLAVNIVVAERDYPAMISRTSDPGDLLIPCNSSDTATTHTEVILLPHTAGATSEAARVFVPLAAGVLDRGPYVSIAG